MLLVRKWCYMSKNLVVKHNALINASYRLSLAEQRLILLSIVEARRIGADITPMDRLTISADIYAKAFNTTRQASYMALKDACDNLFNREYGYMEILDKGVSVVRSRWVSEIAYNEKQATVGLIFSPSIVPYITNLEKQFTSYDLEQVAELNSRYSVRLYEIVIAWKNNGKTNQISIQDLRDRLGLLDDEYTAIHNFKARVLQASINEINKKTVITLSYEQHKQGRKIVGFTFTIKHKALAKPKKSKKNTNKDPSTQDMFDDLTDQERQIIAQKNAYANQIGATAEHRENLIRQGLITHRQAEQSKQERQQREKAEHQAQEQRDKDRLELAQRQFEQILASDELITAYIAKNINPKYLSGLQKIYYDNSDFKNMFSMEKCKFEKIHEHQRLILDFLDF